MSRLLGLRIDVDTHGGMRDGVPRLLEILGGAHIKGTFYFAMGPDRSGLAAANLLTRPAFLAKMLRTRAPRIYGLRTLLSGTLLPSRPVATAFPELLRRAEAEGHETGTHGWDHRRWQDRLLRLPPGDVIQDLERSAQAYARILGRPPRTAAAPAWLSRGTSLRHQEGMGLLFASDCRGREPFLPRVAGRILDTPQVPATLPTLDEVLGRQTPAEFFSRTLDLALQFPWPVLTLHAELEGGPYAQDFAAFLARARDSGLTPVPLGTLLSARRAQGTPLPRCPLFHAPVEGRHGVVSRQSVDDAN